MLNIKLHIWMGNVQYAISHQQNTFLHSRPRQDSKGNESLEPDGGCWMCIPPQNRVKELEQEKFTQLGQWESSFALRGQSVGCLVDQNTSFPSRCERRFVKDDPNVKFSTTSTSLEGSFDPYVFFNKNSFLSGRSPIGPPYKYYFYNVNYLKTWT